MKNKSAILLLLIFSLTMLGSFLFVTPVSAAIQLVKSADFGTVYYIDSRGVRHTFPNEVTYKSWYGNNFSQIVIVSNDFLSNYPLGDNITIRPGTYLVKIRTAPQTYTVEQGGVLRELQNESIAQAIYGQDWAKRVVDVPDVFFDNYILGEPIIHDYTTPDSILYQDEQSKKYYYRNNNILRFFESKQAVLDNYFNLDHAIVRNRSYYIRQRPISGLDKNVLNPVALPLFDTRDCENKKLKAAMIFLVDQSYSPDEIERLQIIKKSISAHFSYVTNDLSEIDIDYPTIILLDNGYLTKEQIDGTTSIENEVLNTFMLCNDNESFKSIEEGCTRITQGGRFKVTNDIFQASLDKIVRSISTIKKSVTCDIQPLLDKINIEKSDVEPSPTTNTKINTEQISIEKEQLTEILKVEEQPKEISDHGKLKIFFSLISTDQNISNDLMLKMNNEVKTYNGLKSFILNNSVPDNIIVAKRVMDLNKYKLRDSRFIKNSIINWKESIDITLSRVLSDIDDEDVDADFPMSIFNDV